MLPQDTISSLISEHKAGQLPDVDNILHLADYSDGFESNTFLQSIFQIQNISDELSVWNYLFHMQPRPIICNASKAYTEMNISQRRFQTAIDKFVDAGVVKKYNDKNHNNCIYFVGYDYFNKYHKEEQYERIPNLHPALGFLAPKKKKGGQ
jgi:hypothetical protein